MNHNKSRGTEVLSAVVPVEIKEIVTKLATDEDRTTSQVVRKLLEESPRVKSELRRKRAA